MSNPSEPWRELPAGVADVLEPVLPAVADETLAAIGREIPEYAHPLEGEFGKAVRSGVEEALRRFIALVREAGAVVERIAKLGPAPLADLTPTARARMSATALAYVQHVGNAVAIGRDLHVHPETAWYRIARLRELLGAQLDDPDARFELEVALRALNGEGASRGQLLLA